ncbi:fibronectin type III domain-containing protein [Chengkuizengella axinellae]|uniref:Fibronectin type III domain-containing protein n=1 Tax=Chengkuizengella axinellae TaxID=3064388 RepID=A0ABT9J2P5_9BACL|nr:S-layer homology domain-containing protein [Chengkuizengella sp. 2205SS18-9]MDP5275295.1 fibronectin type III domain-containing protein [Chengkuizengella sp. 2205SS18-9]
MKNPFYKMISILLVIILFIQPVIQQQMHVAANGDEGVINQDFTTLSDLGEDIDMGEIGKPLGQQGLEIDTGNEQLDNTSRNENVSTLSNNTNLIDLTISAGNISFNPNQTEYVVEVDNGLESITITPTAEHENAMIKVDADIVPSGSEINLPLEVNGETTIEIKVIAEDETIEKTYTIKVTKASTLSDNSNLSQIMIKKDGISPISLSIEANKFEHVLEVENVIDTITINPTAEHDKASITMEMDGDLVTESDSMDLAVGENIIEVRVTAEDGEAELTYAITILRAQPLHVEESSPSTLMMEPASIIAADSLIKDDLLEKDIKSRLELPEDHELKEEDLEKLTDLSLIAPFYGSYEGLEYAVNLTELNLLAPSPSGVPSLGELTQLTSLIIDSSMALYTNRIDVTNLGSLINLTRLVIKKSDITDIRSLESLTNLVYLDLWLNNITDITSVGNLTNLEYLDLSANNITDISSLSNLTKLGYLDLAVNNITDITNLENVTNLYFLDLFNNNVTDISSLYGLQNLYELDLAHNNVTDISSIILKPNLEILNLSNNKITNIESLYLNGSLHTLDLSNNKITDIEPLGNTTFNVGLWSLRTLDLRYNNISDISPLVHSDSLQNLKTIYLDGNPLNDEAEEIIITLRERGAQVHYSGLPYLRDIIVIGGDLSRDYFIPHIFEYDLLVTNAIETVRVTPEAVHDQVTIKINGNIVESGSEIDIRLEGSVFITVTGLDGAETTYTLYVQRFTKTVPSAPTKVSSIGGKGEVKVQFTAPDDNGGSEIDVYKVIDTEGNVKGTGVESPITVTGLKDGTNYTFAVIAKNYYGDSPSSDQVSAITIPGTTEITKVAPGNKQVNLQWEEVEGATTYKIYQSTESGIQGTLVGTVESLSYDVLNLTNGTDYFFAVASVNDSGEGDLSNQESAVPMTVPSVPTEIEAIGGKGEITVSFTPPNNGGSEITEYEVIDADENVKETGNGSPITVTGLEDGTNYTFTVIAKNAVGNSESSSTVTDITIPGATEVTIVSSGNKQVILSWEEVKGATAYNIYQSTEFGIQGKLVGRVESLSYDVLNLTNGTDYFFAVASVNDSGEGELSNQESAVPMTVPLAPTNVTATAGVNGKATVSFTAPNDDGGSEITGYEVSASPGNIQVIGTESPVTITGLSNIQTYMFTVKAINSVGKGEASEESNAVSPRSTSNGGSNSGGSNNDNTEDETEEEITPEEDMTAGEDVTLKETTETTDETDNQEPSEIEIETQMKTEKTEEGKTITMVTPAAEVIETELKQSQENDIVILKVETASDVVVGQLNGEIVKNMEEQQLVLEIQTDHATYTLPAAEIDINKIATQFGKDTEVENIQVEIEISKPSDEVLEMVENVAAEGELSIIVPPIKFTVKAKSGDKTIEIDTFTGFVERLIAIPKGVDPSLITTGVVVEPDGTYRSVPTEIIEMEGKYFANISSTTNSIYTLISNEVSFKDVQSHWAKEAVNDMGSRMIISGVGNNMFKPDEEITRAEFAAIIVRGLGLKLEKGATPFTDVKSTAWYNDVIHTAYSYQLIKGYEDGTFRPNEKVTREQAMVIIAKAMELTELKEKLPSKTIEEQLGSYEDANQASEWAKKSLADVLQAGIITGKNELELAPKVNITRAEVAIMIQRLLEKSGLI